MKKNHTSLQVAQLVLLSCNFLIGLLNFIFKYN
ncbi:hypothetical protein HMPREF1207_05649 [Paenibacillus sp. HGH0039]|nr:hypothetical protein HMPREF1207_05649 [Paenibacillus sp. HGH0039]